MAKPAGLTIVVLLRIPSTDWKKAASFPYWPQLSEAKRRNECSIADGSFDCTSPKGMPMVSRVGLFVAAGAMAGAGIAADDWTQFRGPNADNVSKGPPVPTEWSADKNIKWKTAIPGTGWSAPVVVGDHVFVTSAYSEKQTKPRAFGGGGGGGGGRGRGGFGGPPGGGPPGGGRPGDGKDAPKGEAMKRQGGRGGFGGGGGGGFGRGQKAPDDVYEWQVFCLDRKTGDVVWKKAQSSKPSIPTQPSNTYASETPITDGERLYVYFGMTGLFCYDLKGEKLWSIDLGSYPMMAGWGTGSSPVLLGDKLFVQCDNEQKSFIIALDREERQGSVANATRREVELEHAVHLEEQIADGLVTLGGGRVRSYNPENGELLWEMKGLDSSSMSSPASDADAIFFGIPVHGRTHRCSPSRRVVPVTSPSRRANPPVNSSCGRKPRPVPGLLLRCFWTAGCMSQGTAS